MVWGSWTLGEQETGGNRSVSGSWGRRSPPFGQGDLFRKLSATPNLCLVVEDWLTKCSYWPVQKPFPTESGSLQQAQQELTMSTTFAITRIKMANMAQVFLAQRVRSIQVEKATSFLGKA